MNQVFTGSMFFSLAVPVFYLLLQIFTFCLYGIDKAKAKKRARRISEKTLLSFSFFAPFGALAGMWFFRHKTKKLYFLAICIVSVLLHFSLLFYFKF